MKYLCIWLIKFYRKCISPLKGRPCCRFVPTCSAYALEAFQTRGFFIGLILSVWRILRCNPFCAGGYDPVPEKGLRYKGSREIPTSLQGCSGEEGSCCHRDSEQAASDTVADAEIASPQEDGGEPTPDDPLSIERTKINEEQEND